MILKDLNSVQTEAVEFVDSPVLIFAGAGIAEGDHVLAALQVLASRQLQSLLRNGHVAQE